MARLTPGDAAPAFTLRDTAGNAVSMADFHGKAHVLLVLNRGFK